MSIEELKKLCDCLAVERAELENLRKKLAACKLSGHQHDIGVSISGVGNTALTSMSRETGWAARVISGREMILLGVKKVLAALVDDQAELVRKIEQQIADARVTQ